MKELTNQEAVRLSRKRKLVDDGKFDRHFKRARARDMEARKKAFVECVESCYAQIERVLNIKSSTY